MSAAQPQRRPLERPPVRPYFYAIGMLIGLALLCYFAFNPALPFQSRYEVSALFKSSNGLRKGSPVRVSGVEVGKVTGVEAGPGSTTRVTMELEDSVRPVHKDATADIQPRVFLEGGFLVDLHPGTPGSPELGGGGSLPLSQTSVPVQFNQMISTIDAPARKSIRTLLRESARAFEGGGAQGLRKLSPHLKPLLRDTAWVAEASRGSHPGDVSRLISSYSRITAALDTDQTGDLVRNFAATAASFAAEDESLARGIEATSDVLDATPPALSATARMLPRIERASRQIEPALGVAPRSFSETTSTLRELGSLATPSRRPKTVAAVRTAFVDLPELTGTLARVLPAAGPLSDCLSSHVVPLLEAKVPDGELSSNRGVWEDFAHSIVGLAGGSQNFDGDGHALRYQAGFGTQTLSLVGAGALGQLQALAPPTLRSRPTPPSGGAPAFKTDEECSKQAQPDLNTPSGGAGLTAAGRVRASKVKPRTFKRLLRSGKLRRALRRSGK